MQTIHQTIQITYRYSVHFTNHLFAPENPLLRDVISVEGPKSPKNILCIIDSQVHQHHPDLLAAIPSYCHHHTPLLHLTCPPLIIEGGENAKNNPQNVTTIQEAIHRHNICRHSYIIVIGGGAIIDLVGYAAATAH